MATEQKQTVQPLASAASGKLGIGMDFITEATPTLPNVKRGDTSDHLVTETPEQLKDNLVWWPCSFCGRYVLVDSFRFTRERCKCGAVRIHSKGSEGWRKDDEEWWFI